MSTNSTSAGSLLAGATIEVDGKTHALVAKIYPQVRTVSSASTVFDVLSRPPSSAARPCRPS
jgi:hypothetical protein